MTGGKHEDPWKARRRGSRSMLKRVRGRALRPLRGSAERVEKHVEEGQRSCTKTFGRFAERVRKYVEEGQRSC